MPKNPLASLLDGNTESDEESDDAAEEEAMNDFIAAVKAGDATAASLALKRHYEACGLYTDIDEDEGDEEV